MKRSATTAALGAIGDPEENSAERTKALLAAIVESSDDAIVSKNLDGTITSWNHAAERIFGYTAEEIIGRSVLTLIPVELHSQETEILEKLKSGERIQHYETIRLRKDGERLELSLTISPVKDESGRTIGASKIARDISERRRMERLLIQSEKLAATGRMAATIAHEINNPLEAVLNLIYLARTSASVGTEVREYLATAEMEIERVSLIARQTLGYFRETHRAVEVHLDEMLDQVTSVYEPKLRANRIRVQRDFTASRGLLAKKGELTQIFSNLVSNAIDVMPNGGVLRLKVVEGMEGGREGLQVMVADEGPGILEQDQGRIFEAFFTTKAARGTGIGLWISRRFVEGHGGTIRLETSTDEANHGTRFFLFFPFERVLEEQPNE